MTGDSNWRCWTASPALFFLLGLWFPSDLHVTEREKRREIFESTLLKVGSDPVQNLELLISHTHKRTRLFQSQVCCLVVYCLHWQLPSKRLLTIGSVIWAYLPMQTVKYYLNQKQGEKVTDLLSLTYLNLFSTAQKLTTCPQSRSGLSQGLPCLTILWF